MIHLLFAALIASIGLAGLLYKRSLIGLLVTSQLMFMGAVAALVGAGAASGAGAQTHVFSLLVVGATVGHGLAACAIAIRAFYLKGNGTIDGLRSLKR